jgi:hypothetical protein
MHLGTKRHADSDAVPLRSAVLCIDCECVTNGRFDECLVCGSRSLLSISKMLGGTPLSDKPNRNTKHQITVLFDLNITIELKQMEPNDVNAAVEQITRLIAARLMQGRACFHISVEPVVSCNTHEARVA